MRPWQGTSGECTSSRGGSRRGIEDSLRLVTRRDARTNSSSAARRGGNRCRREDWCRRRCTRGTNRSDRDHTTGSCDVAWLRPRTGRSAPRVEDSAEASRPDPRLSRSATGGPCGRKGSVSRHQANRIGRRWAPTDADALGPPSRDGTLHRTQPLRVAICEESCPRSGVVPLW